MISVYGRFKVVYCFIKALPLMHGIVISTGTLLFRNSCAIYLPNINSIITYFFLEFKICLINVLDLLRIEEYGARD